MRLLTVILLVILACLNSTAWGRPDAMYSPAVVEIGVKLIDTPTQTVTVMGSLGIVPATASTPASLVVSSSAASTPATLIVSSSTVSMPGWLAIVQATVSTPTGISVLLSAANTPDTIVASSSSVAVPGEMIAVVAIANVPDGIDVPAPSVPTIQSDLAVVFVTASMADEPFATNDSQVNEFESMPKIIATADVSTEKVAEQVAADLSTPEPIAPESVDEAGFTSLILTCEDDTALRELLTGMGLSLRDPNTAARALPEFFTTVGSMTTSLRVTDAEVVALVGIEQPGDIHIVRYIAGSDAMVSYVVTHTDQKFLVVVDIHNLTSAALTSLAGQNIVAIVVGHYDAYHGDDEAFADYAAKTLAVTKAIRLVSDAPVLLAASVTHDARTWLRHAPRRARLAGKEWAAAFGAAGLKNFDGFGIYNLSNWPALLEAPVLADGTKENPRTKALAMLGLPEKPCVLLDFLGGPWKYSPEMADRVRAMWTAKAPLLIEAMKAQGWHGLTLHTPNLADAQLKADVLRNIGTD